VIEQIVIIAVFLALGGMLKGVVGMGTPVIAVPAIAAFFSVPYAIAILVFPNIITNGWQVWQFRRERNALPFLGIFVATGIFGVLAGTWILTAVPANILSFALALIVVAYIILRVARPHWSIAPKAAARMAPAVGAVSGLLQGAMGISAPVSVTFLNALKLNRPQFAFSISALFLGFTLLQLPALSVAGIFTGHVAVQSLLAIIPVLAGMWAGNSLAGYVNARMFDRLILVVLALIALKLVYDVGADSGML